MLLYHNKIKLFDSTLLYNHILTGEKITEVTQPIMHPMLARPKPLPFTCLSSLLARSSGLEPETTLCQEAFYHAVTSRFGTTNAGISTWNRTKNLHRTGGTLPLRLSAA